MAARKPKPLKSADTTLALARHNVHGERLLYIQWCCFDVQDAKRLRDWLDEFIPWAGDKPQRRHSRHVAAPDAAQRGDTAANAAGVRDARLAMGNPLRGGRRASEGRGRKP